MTKNLLIILLAAVVTSGVWILCINAKSHKWYSRNYVCVVLTDDVVLKSGRSNEVVGTLRKGVILFVPDGEDYRVTDPSDSSLHKVYVSLTADMRGKFLRVPQEFSPTNQSVETYNYLDMYPQK